MTVKQLYDFAFDHALLDAEIETVKQLYIQLSIPIKDTLKNVPGNSLLLRENKSKWSTLVEYTYEDVLELLS